MAERAHAPDPLAPSAVLIEDLERQRADAETDRQREPRAWPKIPDINVDIVQVAIVLLVVAFWLLLGSILAVSRLPPPLDPYTVPVKLALSAVVLGGTGIGLLALAARISNAAPPSV